MATTELPPTAESPPAKPDDAPGGPARTSARRTDWLVGAAAAAVALVIALIDLKIWNADLSVPFRLGGDADFYLMVTTSMLRHGWHLTNPDLGAPFGSTLYDLPQGADNLQYLLIKIIGTITGGDAARAVNLYFLATFPLAAAFAYAVLRSLRITRVPAAVFAVLYALLPYHFERGTTHLLLSGYYLVPVGIWLILRTLADDAPFSRDGTWKPRFTQQSILPIVACAAIASTGAYYAMFTLVLLVPVALADFAVRRRVRTLTAATVTAIFVGGVFLINVAPTVVYAIANGQNTAVAQRTPQETELYGLRIAELVVPRADHRIGPLGYFERQISEFPQRSEAGMPLGLIGAIGFLFLVALAVILVLGRRHSATSSRSESRVNTRFTEELRIRRLQS